MDEGDEVGVLLDGARLAQVRQHGPSLLLLAALELAIELRERHDRHVKLLGQGLEAPRHLGDLAFARLVTTARGPADELDVIDHDEPAVCALSGHSRVGREAPRLGADLPDGRGGGLVDEDGRRLEARGRSRQRLPLARAEVSGPQPAHLHAGLRAQHPLGELPFGHLEGEHERGHTGLERGVEREPEGEGRLAHRGSRGDDVEVAGLEPTGEAIEPSKAGGHARDADSPLPLHCVVERRLHGRPQGHVGLPVRCLSDLEDSLLGAIDKRGHVARPVRRLGEELAQRVHEAAQGRVLEHDARVVLDVHGARHVVEQVGQERLLALEAHELACPSELGGHAHGVDRVLRRLHADHSLEHERVAGVLEVAGRKPEGHDVGERADTAQEDGAEHGSLGPAVTRGESVRWHDRVVRADRVRRRCGQGRATTAPRPAAVVSEPGGMLDPIPAGVGVAVSSSAG